MRVTIHQDHIIRAWQARAQGICSTCPMALAIQDATGLESAWTNGFDYGLTPLGLEFPWIGERKHFTLPEEAVEWVSAYDRWAHTGFSTGSADYPAPRTPATFDL